VSAHSSTTKSQPLTEHDMAGFRPRAAVLEALETQRARLGVQPGEMTVVDWGCGRGELTLWLRRLGYRAFGIDVSPQWIENGRALARKWGLPAERTLLNFEESYRAPFAERSVDFISSDQVLEHVSELADFAGETWRVLKPAGEALHVYPAHLRVIEGHLMMPLVHWLPKTRVRRAAIRACVALGIEPKDWQLDDQPAEVRADRYYEYSCLNTFYRTPVQIEAAFQAAGFRVEFDVRRIRGVQSRPWAEALFGYPGTAGLMSWALLRFGAISLRCRKPATSC